MACLLERLPPTALDAVVQNADSLTVKGKVLYNGGSISLVVEEGGNCFVLFCFFPGRHRYVAAP